MSLEGLAKILCPHLGIKGRFDHKNLMVGDLSSWREEVVKYLMQDIRLLGGIMLRVSEAEELIDVMKNTGLEPNAYSYTCLVIGHCKAVVEP